MVFTNMCKNPQHEEWQQHYSSSYPEDTKFKLIRVLSDEFDLFEKISHVRITRKKDAKFCELCVNVLYEKYQSHISSPLAKSNEHLYSSPPVSAAKRKCVYKQGDEQQGSCDLLINQIIDPKFINGLDSENTSKLAYLLGCKISSSLRPTAEKLCKMYKDSDQLKHLDLEQYLKTFSTDICSFLDGLLFTSQQKCDSMYKKAVVLEHLLHLVRPNEILPLCFLQNLILYNITNSKQAVNLLGENGPHGSYDTIKHWLGNQSMKPLPFPKNDCVVIFDNNQIIGRSWKIKVNNKVKSSVVTTICQIEYPGYGGLQNLSHLLPKFWNLNLPHLMKNVREIPEALTNYHYQLLYIAISENLETVLLQQQKLHDRFIDSIDENIVQQIESETTKICQKCGHINLKTKRICSNNHCRSNLKQAELDSSEDDYLGTFQQKTRNSRKRMSEIRLTAKPADDGTFFIECESESNTQSKTFQFLKNGHPKNKPKLSLSDPSFVNPNSFEATRTILRQIGVQAGIKLYTENGKREWVFIVCDGLPFGLCQSVITSTYRCKNCPHSTESFTSKEMFQNHHQASHHDQVPDEFLEFQWVVLRPGNGHFEMNMCKTFVELNWDVYFGELAKIMGFRSENAQRAAKKCTDHHKSWSLLRIAHQGTMQELMIPYVRDTLRADGEVSPKGFLNYTMLTAKNPNYIYMANMTMTYLQAIINFRAGLRVGNIDAITSAKAVFAPLFHARCHPRYQEIEMTDAIQRHCVPHELLEFFNQTESVSLTDDNTSGEGLDFKAEVVNKDVQSWMPRGVPTGEDWLRVTRNLENLKELRTKVKRMVDGEDACRRTEFQRSTRINEQVFAWRVHLRRKKYLSNPCDATLEHTSISSEKLDSSLIEITTLSENMRKLYFDKKFSLDVPDNQLQPIYVTQKERNEKNLISNKTKTEIYDAIAKLIECIVDGDVKESIKSEFQKFGQISRVKKDELLKFHELLEDINTQQDMSLQQDLCV